MGHGVAACERLVDRRRISQISLDLNQARMAGDAIKNIVTEQIEVEHRDGMPEFEQTRNKGASNIAGTPGNENILGGRHCVNSAIMSSGGVRNGVGLPAHLNVQDGMKQRQMPNLDESVFLVGEEEIEVAHRTQRVIGGEA